MRLLDRSGVDVDRPGTAYQDDRRFFAERAKMIVRNGSLAWVLGILTAAFAAADDRFPPELVRFEPLPGQPAFQGAGKGAWDARIRERGWVLREPDGWKLWYTGYDGTRGGLKMLGLATSTDGLHWTRHPGNPLVRETWVEDVCVVPHEGRYHLFAEGFLDRPHAFTSDDGIHWRREGLLDVRLTNGGPLDNGPLGTPCVFIDHGVWHLLYERRDAGIWHATSPDRVVWTNVQDDPVLTPGPDTYDRDLIACNQVFVHRGRYYMVFHGAAKAQTPAVWSTGLAVSDDLKTWDKYPGNPLRPIAENKSSGQIVPVDEGFWLFTHHDRVVIHAHPQP
jgi:hypothetical protein